MRQRIKTILENTPTPMAGLALGISGLGWSAENALSTHHTLQITSAGIALILILVVASKFMLWPQKLLTDLSHPVIGSVVPTFAMTLMIISNSIEYFNHILAEIVWLIAVIIHLLFLATFIFHRAKVFELHHMVPSWFVPPVGIIVADVAFPGGVLQPLAITLLYFGLVCYAILLPVMLYRIIFCHEIPDASKPTIAIFAAPASLSLAGYLTVIEDPSPNVVILLVGIAILMTALIYIAFIKLMTLPFSPGFSAFTFPMAIGSTALFKTAHWAETVIHLPPEYVAQIYYLAVFELIIATLVIGFVAQQYLYHLVLKKFNIGAVNKVSGMKKKINA
ncbi:TDT family transporter [Fastidiosibacter lacustris]|uniref:TDT family transporter n=1 Tax=Fastidiosibacter lacustris TaxID=2056695 RepID=UPI000E34131A|nr:TDT family transporter [Fastidiosibacter lacustris]